MEEDKKNSNSITDFRDIYDQYLGASKIYHVADDAEKKPSEATYHGEKRNWIFSKFSTLHKDKHNILERLLGHGYTVIGERYNVRRLV